MRFLRRTYLLTLATALAVASPLSAPAQSWPSRSVMMVVPFPAGGNNDVIARAVAAALSERLGRQFVVDNRAGAGGNIGATTVAKSAPDGYTLLFSSPGAIAQNKLMYRNMGYDPDRDFQPVVLVANSPLIITAKKEAPFGDLKGLVAYAKANPGKLNVGNPGQGTIGHITSVLLQMTAGVELVDVPYRGTASIVTDLLGGQIDLGVDFMSSYIELVKDGKIKVIAITGGRRSAALTEAPTVIETGVANFEASAWYAIMAPSGTPTEIVHRINVAVNEWLQTDKAKILLAGMAMQANGGSPDDLKAFIAGEVAKWGPVIKAANIQF